MINTKEILEQLLVTAKTVATQGQDKAQDLASQGQVLAKSLSEKGQTIAKDLADKGQGMAQDLLAKGQTLAEEKLGMPKAGPERDAMLSGIGKGALAASAVAILLGTNAGRKVTGTAAKLGSLAAIGGLAYKAFTDWQAKQGNPSAISSQPINELPEEAANQRSTSLLKAMIAAAKADGHIDDSERARIEEQIHKLGLDQETEDFFKAEIEKPLNAAEIAATVDSPEAAAELYLVSYMVIDVDSPSEEAYLDELAKNLGLAPELVSQLQAQAAA